MAMSSEDKTKLLKYTRENQSTFLKRTRREQGPDASKTVALGMLTAVVLELEKTLGAKSVAHILYGLADDYACK